MIRAVLDTNVLVSAIISGGKSRDLLKRGIARQYLVVTSDLILKELVSVLSRPKFKTSEDEVHRTIVALIRTVDVVDVRTKIKAVVVDPKDDMVIETAVDGDAEIIVSGDNHLLSLQTFEGIKIVTVEEMLSYLPP
jgi:putative PIN family toxin of toxin-antitoxin system